MLYVTIRYVDLGINMKDGHTVCSIELFRSLKKDSLSH